MKILLVTSLLAEPIVKRYAKKSPMNPTVITLPFAVAALMTTRYIEAKLKEMKLKKFDMILLPGLIRGDVSDIAKKIKKPVFKGPRHAADIPSVLEATKKIKFSTNIPADDIIRGELIEKALKILKDTEKNKNELLKKKGNILIGNLAVGKDFPARIVAEIVNAPKMTDDEIRLKAEYYADSGANIIDIGMMAGMNMPKDAARAITIVKESMDLPVSIDSMNPTEIEAAVSAGADLIVSIDANNMKEISKFGTHLPVVVLPTDFHKGLFPRQADERVTLLEKNIAKAKEYGFTKIIADPILDPLISPGTTESIAATRKFRQNDKHTPIFWGVGNVTELMDADSPGVNAMLAGLAAELEVSFLLTTEVSDKVRGSVIELNRASEMMFLAKKRESIPKELGIDLLILKEEKLKIDQIDKEMIETTEILDIINDQKYFPDPKGCFKILIDRENRDILLLYYKRSNMIKPELIIKGKNAKNLYKTASKKGIISTLEHASYLGSELEKANIALRIGRSYIQDNPLF